MQNLHEIHLFSETLETFNLFLLNNLNSLRISQSSLEQEIQLRHFIETCMLNQNCWFLDFFRKCLEIFFVHVNFDQTSEVNRLVDEGVDVNCKYYVNETTALQLTVHKGSISLKIVFFCCWFLTLINFNVANYDIVKIPSIVVSRTNKKRDTPLHYAGLYVHMIIDQHNVTIVSLNSSVFWVGKMDVARLLIDEGANVNAKNEETKIPLQNTTYQGDFECFRPI